MVIQWKGDALRDPHEHLTVDILRCDALPQALTRAVQQPASGSTSSGWSQPHEKAEKHRSDYHQYHHDGPEGPQALFSTALRGRRTFSLHQLLSAGVCSDPD